MFIQTQETPNPAATYNPFANGDCPSCYPVTYADWNTVTLDLSAYQGQQITAVFRVEWCGPGPDWAYVLLDVDCPINTFEPTNICLDESGQGTLCGPDNMSSYNWHDSTGTIIGNNQCLDVINPGTYGLQAMPDDVECTSASLLIFDFIVDPQLSLSSLVSNYNGNNISCYGSNDGSIQLDVNGGAPPYNYNWSNLAASSSQFNMYAGSYDLQLTDSKGCNFDTTFLLIEPTLLQTTIVSITDYNTYDISCYGNNDGGALVTVIGSTPVYTYLWSNGETSPNAVNLSSGLSSVIVTDANSCITSNSILMIEPSQLQNTIVSLSNYNGYDISCNGYSNGSIVLTVSGSVSGYTYLWNTGSTSDFINNLSSGMYTVEIVDFNGCLIKDSIFLNDPSVLISNYTIESANGYGVCIDALDGIINLTSTGSVPVYSYIWNNGETTEDLVNLGAGTYYYSLTDQNGCITSDTIELIEPVLSIQETVIDVSCFGGINGAVSVSVSGSTSPYYIFWDNNINTNTLSAGSYSYQLIDSIGCVYQDTLIVLEPAPLIVSENITNVSCNGFDDGAISLDISGATPPYLVDWFGVSTTNMSAGTYNFTILDSNNCAYSEIAIVTEPNAIDVLNQVISPTCGNTIDGSVSLSISGGTPVYSINWGGNNPNSLAMGTYDFVIIDDNNCIDSNSVTLVAESNIQAISSVTKISCNSFCDGAIDLQINGGVAPYTLDWFGLNSAALCEGFVSYELIDAIGCSYSESFMMVPPDSVGLIINQNGTQLEANASGGVSPYYYKWFNDLGFLVDSQNVNITNNGNYYCVAIDANYCQSDTITYFYSETSVNDSEISNFNIYPNPSNDCINIEFKSINAQNYSIYLVDLLGQKILLDRVDKYKGQYSYKMDLIEFAQGIYILELKSENEIYNKKIIKK